MTGNSGDVKIKNLPAKKSGKKETKPETKPEEDLGKVLSPAHQKKAEQLANFYADIAVGVMAFNPDAGKIIFVNALERATEVLRVARHHPRLMAVVDRLIEGNDYLTLAVGHATMFGSIYALQGKLSDNPISQKLKLQGQISLMRWSAYETQLGQMNGDQSFTMETGTPA